MRIRLTQFFVSIITLTLMTAFIFTACGKSDKENAKNTPPQEKVGVKSEGNTGAPSTAKSEATKSKEEHVLQLTVINFLTGGLEACNIKDKAYTFSMQDKNVKTSICKNSTVEVFAISDSGTVTFHAMDIGAKAELLATDSSQNPSFKLGKTEKTLRYGFQNPYGFTYVIAEEITGMDPKLLSQWNELNRKRSELLAEALNAEKNGEIVSAEVQDEISKLDVQLADLAKKLLESKKENQTPANSTTKTVPAAATPAPAASATLAPTAPAIAPAAAKGPSPKTTVTLPHIAP